MKVYNVAVVGATGAVGLEMVSLLERRNFPVNKLYLFASERSEGKIIKFRGEECKVVRLSPENIPGGLDIALFSAGASVSREYAPLFVNKGVFVIDNSSAWRMEPEIPLVVPEVNVHVLSKDKKLISNPNCSTIQMVVVLHPIDKYAKITRVVVSTYQSVSGAGGRAINELLEQSRKFLAGEEIPRVPGGKFPYRIAFNLFPHIDVFLENGYTKEEMKMVNETKKIMSRQDLKISATCVRVPVIRAHSESVWIETERKVTPGEVREILRGAPGVKVVDDVDRLEYPMPIDAEYNEYTFVGRIREDISMERGIVLWIVSDNLWKGAALNAVQIAEALVERGVV
jgi:aspartate-semialdehyde dehydrogenase